MDIGTAVAWIQLIIWVIALVGYFAKKKKEGVPMPLLPSKVMGVIVVLGFLLSGFSLYMSYSNTRIGVKEWEEQINSSLEPVRDKTFTNEQVELDGKEFDDCTFRSPTLIYRGKKPFHFRNLKIEANSHPIQMKVVQGPAAFLITMLVNGVCQDAAQRGVIAPCISAVNVTIVDENLNPVP